MIEAIKIMDGGQSAGPIPLGRLPAFHAGQGPARPMLTFQDRTVSHGEFDSVTNRLARQLAASGVRAGDFAAMVLPNGLAPYQIAFALWKIGATPVPLSTAMPPAELGEIIKLLQPRLVLGSGHFELPGMADPAREIVPDHAFSDAPLPDANPAYWKAVTSGGSTGRPKIIVSHMASVWNPSTAVFGAVPGSTVLNSGPFYHNAPFTNTMWHLFSGSHVIEGGKFDAIATLELIERHRVQWVSLVPTTMQRIWRLDPALRDSFDLSSLRHVWHMASMCPIWLKERWIEWLGADRIFELYGGSESNGGSIISGTDWLAHKGSVGRTSDQFRLCILDDTGRECAPGEAGEIFMAPVSGEPTFHYIGAEASEVNGLQSLGDIGYLDEEGYLYLLDRRKDMIVTGAANVYPAEVESALDEHAAVQSSLVVGIPDEEWGHRVHALVQLTEPMNADAAMYELRRHLRERLAPYKLPKTFEFVDRPLRDDAGKARRTSVAAKLAESNVSAPSR